jgi:hypothetical protein
MLPLHTLQHFGKHFNDRLDTSTTADTLLPPVMPKVVENQSCIQNRITQHLQLTGWKSLLVFILLLKSYCRKHNARDENHDDSTKTF